MLTPAGSFVSVICSDLRAPRHEKTLSARDYDTAQVQTFVYRGVYTGRCAAAARNEDSLEPRLNGQAWLARFLAVFEGFRRLHQRNSQNRDTIAYQNFTIVLRVSVDCRVTTAGPPLKKCHAEYCSM